MSQLTAEHINTLVNHFYRRIQHDEILCPIFNDVAKVDWDHHIPLICQFWNSIMLKTNEYHSNAYRKHIILGEKIQLTEKHFDHWLLLFQEESLKHLPTQAAHLIIEKAKLIAASLKIGSVSKE